MINVGHFISSAISVSNPSVTLCFLQPSDPYGTRCNAPVMPLFVCLKDNLRSCLAFQPSGPPARLLPESVFSHGDSAVLLERQEFTNRAGQSEVSETVTGSRLAPNNWGGNAASNKSGVLLADSAPARTHGKGMRVLVAAAKLGLEEAV